MDSSPTIQKAFGLYLDADEKDAPTSDLSMDFVVPLEFMNQWERVGLVSDFLARFQAFNSTEHKISLNTLSTIINELIENSVKFSMDKNKLVSLSLRQFESGISIETINTTNEKNAISLDRFTERLTNSDPETLFFERIEESAISNSNSSGLGLLSILKDYNDAQLGIKIVPHSVGDDVYDVYIKVIIGTDIFEEGSSPSS
jgi:hypothetical protein